MDSKRNYSAKQLKPKIAAAFLAYLCCLGLVFFNAPAASAGLFSDGVAEMGEAGKTVAQAAKKTFFGPASIFDGIKCFFGFDCPPKPAASRVAIGSAAGRIMGDKTANQAGPKPGQAGKSDESPESKAVLTADPAAMPPATGVYANLPAPEPTPEPEPGILSGVSQFFEMTFEPAQPPAQDIVACTNTVIVDEETKRKVDIILRQLNSDTPHFGLGQLVKKPANLDMDSLKISSGAFSVDKHGNIATEGDLEVTGNFTVSGAQTYSGAVTLNASTSIPLFKIEQSGSGVALEADNITLKGSAIGTNDTDTDLLINPNGTGAVQFHTASNYIDPAGSLVLNGDITLTSGGTFYTTDNGDLVFAPNGTGNLVVGENGNPASIIPFKDSTTGYDLGAATARWYDIYAKGKLDIDSTTLTPTQLSFADTGKITTGASKDLTLQPGTNGKTRITDGTDYVDITDGTQALYAIKGATVVKLADGTYAVDAAGDVRITGNLNVSGGILFTSPAGEQIDTTADHLLKLTTTGDAQVVLGDNAGASQFEIKDSDGNTVAGIDSVGKATLADVAVTGELGIGTTNPEEALDVNGRIKLAQTAAPATTADKLYNVSGNLYWNGAVLALGSSVSGTVGYLPKFTASNALGNSILYEDAGKIGVGTAAPGAKLEIRGGVNAGANGTEFTVSPAGAVDAADYNGLVLTSQTTGFTIAGGMTSKTLSLDADIAASTVNTHIADTSNPHGVTKTQVGLGSVENTALSAWSGTANITTLGTISSGTWSGTAISPAKGGTGTANGANNTITFTGNHALGLTLSGDTSLVLPAAGTVAVTSDKLSAFASTASGELAGAISDETGSGALVFGTSPTFTTQLATPKVLGDSTGLYLSDDAGNGIFVKDGGNVGIGTTGPATKLHLAMADTNNALTIENTSNTSGLSDAYGTIYFQGRNGLGVSYVNGAAAIVGAHDANQSVNNRAGVLFFQTAYGSSAPSTKMTIDSAGNVGIGTTAPSALLQIEKSTDGLPATSGSTQSGGLRSRFSLSGSNSVLDVGIVGGSTYSAWLQATNAANLATNSYLLLNPNGGNVGIGTTEPAQLLHLSSIDDAGLLLEADRTGTSLEDNNAFIKFSQDGGVVKSFLGTVGNTGYDPENNTYIDSIANSTLLGTLGAFPLQFGVNGSVRVSIGTTGRVGVGTTSPGARLTIDGTGEATYMWEVRKNGILYAHQVVDGDNNNGIKGVGFLEGTYLAFQNTEGDQDPQLRIFSSAITQNAIIKAYSSTNAATKHDLALQASGKLYLQTLNNDNILIPTGNVGIGTTAPGEMLSVNGNVGVKGSNYLSFGNASGGYWRMHDTTTSNGDFTIENYGSAWDERIRISSSGNVGIGTTSPGYALEVARSGASSQIMMNGDANQIEGIYWGYPRTTSNFALYRPPSTDDLRFWATTYGDLVTIKNTGNVGIGTTAPGALFDVYKTGTNDPIARFGSNGLGDSQSIAVRNGSGAVSIFASGAVGNFLTGTEVGDTGIRWAVGKKFHLGVQAGSGPSLTLDSSGNVGIGTTAPSALLQIEKSTDGLPATSGSTQSGGLRSRYSLSGSNSVLDVGIVGGSTYSAWLQATNAANLATNSYLLLNPNGGNVGIGTTAPAYALDVAGGGYFSSALTANYYRILNGVSSYLSSTMGMIYGSASGGAAYPFLENGNLVIQPRVSSGNARDFVIATGDTTPMARMVVDRSGNVGIGTTGPGAKLHIGGSDTTESHNIALNTNLRMAPTNLSSPNVYADFQTGWDNTNNIGIFNILTRYYDGSWHDRNSLTFLGNGNVGIGTTAPDMKLEVVGSIKATTSLYSPFLYHTGTLVVGNSGGSAPKLSFGNTGITTSGAGDISIMSGSVGIGTTSPTATLHVAAANTTAASLTWGAAAGTILRSEGSELAMGLLNASPYPYWIQARTSGSTVRDIALQPLGGNVGIGTTGPGYLLDVAGAGLVSKFGAETGVIATGGVGAGKANAFLGGYYAGGSSVYFGQNIYYGGIGTGWVNPDAAALKTSLFLQQGGGYYFNTGTTTIGTAKMYLSNAGGLAFGSYASSSVDAGVGNMIISGNVGIGTTAPTVALDVVGNIKATGSVLGSEIAANAGNIKMGSFGGYLGLYTAGSNMGFSNWRNSAYVADMVIQGSTGNVGIGTTTPTATLDVRSGTVPFQWGDNVGNVMGQFNYSSGNPTVLAMSGKKLLLGGNYAVSLALDSTGNVGIGTTAPASKLTVRSDSTAAVVETLRLENLGTAAIGTGGKIAFSLNKDGGVVANFGEIVGLSTSTDATNYSGSMQFKVASNGTLDTLAEFGNPNIVFNRPIEVGVAGDVGISYDLAFMGTGTSHITSSGPLVIAAGDINSAENLILTTQSNEQSGDFGTATAGAATTLTDSAKAWTVDEWIGGTVTIIAGSGKGQTQAIVDNDATSITVADWDAVLGDPAANSVYRLSYAPGGDVLVDLAGSNAVFGGFKVLGNDNGGYAFRVAPDGDIYAGGEGAGGSDLYVKQNITMYGGIFTAKQLQISEAGTPTATSATSGGSCADSTVYYYKVSAVNDNGETAGTAQFTVTTGASGTNINLNTIAWSTVTGATGYKVYRSTENNDWDADANDSWVDGRVVAAPVVTYQDNCSGDTASRAPATSNTTGGKLAINTTSPTRRLEVLENTSAIPQMKIISDGSNYAEAYVDATGDLSLKLTGSGGDDLILLDENLKICSGGDFGSVSCPTWTLNGTGNLVVEGDVYASGGYKNTFSFMYNDVADSQTDKVMDVLGMMGNTEFTLPYGGSVTGVSVSSNADLAGGTITVDPTINGAKTGLTTVADDTHQYNSATQDVNTDTFAAGSRLGVKVTTDANVDPNTIDIIVTVVIEY